MIHLTSERLQQLMNDDDIFRHIVKRNLNTKPGTVDNRRLSALLLAWVAILDSAQFDDSKTEQDGVQDSYEADA